MQPQQDVKQQGGPIEAAELIVKELLGGQWYGTYGNASCPLCEDELSWPRNDAFTLSFNSRNGKILMTCGRANNGNSDCTYEKLTRYLAALGVWPLRTLTPKEIEQLEATRNEVADRNEGRAEEIWEAATPIAGTLTETYLRSRGIDCELPASLRYSPGLWHGPSQAKLPAMIALLNKPSNSYAIHRTYLDPATGQKTTAEPSKMMLGRTTAAGVVLSANSGHVVAVAEGIENGLSLQSGHLRRELGGMTVVAALSNTGLGGLALPRAPADGVLVIAGDGDAAGLEHVPKLHAHAIERGWEVFLHPSPADADWNDVLRGRVK